MYKEHCNSLENGRKKRNTVIAVLLAAGLILTACASHNSVSDSTESSIKKPLTENDVTTWDCIWFGNYWQNTDSNGDGIVTQDDDKEPIKWRVLDIDADGNALLISDQLLDIIDINPEEKEMTWENSILRSFLNSYDASFNVYEMDYSSSGFLNNAFSEEEINAITVSSVKNEDNPVFGTEGGNDAEDKLFCLSITEAISPEYGFVSNEFTEPAEGKKKIFTAKDPTRNAVTTSYADNKEGFTSKEMERSFAPYWTRTSGLDLTYPGHISGNGGAYCASVHMDEYRMNIRPVFRMNLSDSSSLWSYAGTVSSDGTVNENTGLEGEGAEN